MNEKPQDEKADVATWLKRVGVIGFLFFLIKGLLWLIVPALIYYFY
ncbi:MAG: alanyl-tRNA synthetase [Acidobacteria bacterium]|nr:alanyl-tRNA synthetase [Acidobacteriota bacterium]